MAIKRKRLQLQSRTSNIKTPSEKRKVKQSKKLSLQDSSKPSSSSSRPQYMNENNKLECVKGSSESKSKQSKDSMYNNEFSQLKLMTIASGNVLQMRDSDDLWTRSRSLLRKNTSQFLKTKSCSEYHRNNFHLSLKDKWSKVMTNKISALAFSRSLKGRRHPDIACASRTNFFNSRYDTREA